MVASAPLFLHAILKESLHEKDWFVACGARLDCRHEWSDTRFRLSDSLLGHTLIHTALLLRGDIIIAVLFLYCGMLKVLDALKKIMFM